MFLVKALVISIFVVWIKKGVRLILWCVQELNEDWVKSEKHDLKNWLSDKQGKKILVERDGASKEVNEGKKEVVLGVGCSKLFEKSQKICGREVGAVGGREVTRVVVRWRLGCKMFKCQVLLELKGLNFLSF